MQPEQPPQLPAPPPYLAELTLEEYRLWQHQAVSKIFFLFLVDKMEDYQDQVLALLLSDSLDIPQMQEIRGRIWCLKELQELNLDDIKRLYGIEAKPEAKAQDSP